MISDSCGGSGSITCGTGVTGVGWVLGDVRGGLKWAVLCETGWVMDYNETVGYRDVLI